MDTTFIRTFSFKFKFVPIFVYFNSKVDFQVILIFWDFGSLMVAL
jgi:hypothetical protein